MDAETLETTKGPHPEVIRPCKQAALGFRIWPGRWVKEDSNKSRWLHLNTRVYTTVRLLSILFLALQRSVSNSLDDLQSKKKTSFSLLRSCFHSLFIMAVRISVILCFLNILFQLARAVTCFGIEGFAYGNNTSVQGQVNAVPFGNMSSQPIMSKRQNKQINFCSRALCGVPLWPNKLCPNLPL